MSYDPEYYWNHIDTDRNTVIKRIKSALKRRSGKSWSVTGGRGTAWGWIEINVLPRDRTCGHEGSPLHRELATLLGLDSIHFQGRNVAASSDYRREYVMRAEGLTPFKIAEPYWD